MLHRLCGSPSIPLSFILANVLPRWTTYCVCCGTEQLCCPTPSSHRLRRGLPGYLILFAPHAFEPQRQLPSSKPPSPLVFLLISTHAFVKCYCIYFLKNFQFFNFIQFSFKIMQIFYCARSQSVLNYIVVATSTKPSNFSSFKGSF